MAWSADELNSAISGPVAVVLFDNEVTGSIESILLVLQIPNSLRKN